VFENMRKPPKQARAQKTVAAILEAAIQVLDKHGYEATTTNHVAERAGVSVGTLYQYFSNKEEIVTAMLQNYRKQLASEIARELDVASPDTAAETVRRIIRALIRSHRASANARSFEVQTRFAGVRQKPGDGLIGQLLKAKLEEAAQISDPERSMVLSDVGTFVLISAVVGVVQNAVLYDPELLDDPDLEEQLVHLVCGYLRIEIG